MQNIEATYNSEIDEEIITSYPGYSKQNIRTNTIELEGSNTGRKCNLHYGTHSKVLVYIQKCAS